MKTQNSAKYSSVNIQAWPRCTIALTGILGSGKSTVAAILEKNGMPRIDCDQLSRKVTSRNGRGLKELAAALGSRILTQEGELDRKYVLKLIISDTSARKTVERIVHPLVLAELDQELKALASRGEERAVCEVPLLFEAGWQELFDITCLVAAPEESCISRVMKRNGVDPQTAQNWMRLQMPLEKKRALADYIILNDSTLADLEAKVDAFYHWISRRKPCMSKVLK